MVSTEEIIVKITGKDGLSPILARNAREVDKLKRSTQTMGSSFNSVMRKNVEWSKNAQGMGSSLNSVMQEKAQQMKRIHDNVEKYNTSLELSKKQITGGLTPAIQGIDTRNLQKLGADAKNSQQHTNTLTTSISKLKSSMSGLNGVVASLAGLGLGSWLMNSVGKARESQAEWTRFNAVLSEHGGKLDDAKKHITNLSYKYAINAGEIREAERVFMQAGMSYTEMTKNQGALQASMALSVGLNKTTAETADILNKAYTGQGRALKSLGLDIKNYKDSVTGAVDKDRLHHDILEKTAKQLEERGKTSEASYLKFKNALIGLQVTIGSKVLPALQPLLDKLTDFIKWFMDAPPYVHQLVAYLGLFVAGVMVLGPPLLMLSGILKKIGGGIKKIFGFFQKKIGKKTLEIGCKIDPNCNNTDIPNQTNQTNKNKPNTTKKSGGRLGRIRNVLGNLGGRLRSPFNGRLKGILSSGRSGAGNILGKIGGRIGGISGGLLSKIGGIAGKSSGLLSKIGGVAALGSKAIVPLGMAVTAAQAGYGAYTGWTETEGPWQEKAKGAMGGAAEQLSMGLVNKQQVMDGINWLYSQTKNIPGKIGGFLGNLKDIIAQTLTKAWKNARNIVNNGINSIISFIKGLPSRAIAGLSVFANNVKSWIRDAWNTSQKMVNDGINSIIGFVTGLPSRAIAGLSVFANNVKSWIRDAWNTSQRMVNDGVNNIVSAITGLPGRAAGALSSFAGMVKGKMLDALGPAKQFVCSIIGCSPGILPALRQLATETPTHINSVIPYMEKLNQTLKMPLQDINNVFTRSLPSNLPILGRMELPDITDWKGVTTPDMDLVGGVGSYTRKETTVHESGYHVHHHAPITVDARDMTRNEFKSLLVDVLEGAAAHK